MYINADCKMSASAILIAASIRSRVSADMAVPRTWAGNVPKDGNLNGSFMDVALVRALCLKQGISISSIKTGDGKSGDSKNEVSLAIKNLFDQKLDHNVVYYSGHGTKDGGAWCFEDKDNKIEYLNFEDVLSLWNSRSNAHDAQRLYIISDSCFSGQWCDKAEKLSLKNVYIQAATRANELAIDTMNGGWFTMAWVNSNHDVLDITQYMLTNMILLPVRAPKLLYAMFDFITYGYSPICYPALKRDISTYRCNHKVGRGLSFFRGFGAMVVHRNILS